MNTVTMADRVDAYLSYRGRGLPTAKPGTDVHAFARYADSPVTAGR